ncbi:hypothetical protein AM1_A0003 (plasmid) [Acaryochloris marina MBIC11017]|uniref:Uncharacterized protein n=1 Tax=Acaryochloris marina (strain MBIC 11017) TaxID=329726 RepID=A8ZK12_ACAM1|nr:hypothetical protein AM1_A0003 [Acaryochloris marina MBIC11017]
MKEAGFSENSRSREGQPKLAKDAAIAKPYLVAMTAELQIMATETL